MCFHTYEMNNQKGFDFMNRPYIICHMVTSIDGKVTGDFLYRPECERATDVYYELNRKYNKNGANGFLCGRVTNKNGQDRENKITSIFLEKWTLQNHCRAFFRGDSQCGQLLFLKGYFFPQQINHRSCPRYNE